MQSLRAFRNRNFRLYLFGLMVSLAGTYMQTVAEGWLVYQLTNSSFSLGLVGFLTAAPLAPWSLVAGALADRVSRKWLLAIAQIGQIFPPLALAALTWSGHVQVWHIVVLDLLLGTMATVDQPTRQALLADIVDPNELDDSLALMSSGFHVAQVVGPAIAGALIAFIGVGGAFAFNGVSFMAVLIALILIQARTRPKPARQLSLGSSIVEGAKYVVSQRAVVILIFLMVVVSFFILPYQTLLPVFARDIFKAGPTGLGLLTSATGLGAILGALAITNQSSLSRNLRGIVMIVIMIAAALLTVGFAFSQNLILAGVLLALIAGGVTALKTLGFTLIHLQISNELRGRVTSILILMMGATPRVGGLLIGFVASRVGAPLSLGLGAVACLVFGLSAWGLFVPRLRRAV